MDPLRIVLAMTPAPLPFGNAVARWYYVLYKGLVERGHHVQAFASCTTPEEREAALELFAAPKYSLRCHEFPRERDLSSKVAALQRPHSYLFSPELRRDLDAALRGPFDLLHLEALWSGWVGLQHRERALLNLHYLFQIDCADEQPRSLIERVRMRRTIQSENRLIRQYPHLGTISPRLSEFVQQLNPTADVHTIPLGFDLAQYPFELNRSTDAPVVTLIGSFDWRPSFSAGQRLLTRLWPQIRKQIPEARLQIVGRRARAVFSEYTETPGIEIHQDVPEMLPYFRQATVLLYAPGQGSGMKVKVLEAFALGVPVITTAEGVEGIPAVDGIHAGLSEEDAGLISRTVALLRDPAARERQAHAARQLVQQHCAPEVALDIVEAAYRHILEAQRRKGVA